MKIVISILVLILALIQFRLWTGSGSYANIVQLNQSVADQIQENDALENRNSDLYTEINELKTGMEAIEERARSELGLIKKGETFYLIVEEE